jgi:hypothetical protein
MKTQLIPAPRNWQELEPHPLAALVDFGAGIDLEALAGHMRNHGYDADEAIVLHDGMILDGRHKLAAAIRAGITPTFRLFVGTNAMAYTAKKLFRQYLDTSQRAMMAATLAKLSPLAGVQNCTPPTLAEAAATMNVSRRSVANASKVQDAGTPALNQAVTDGTIADDDAARVANEPREVQDQAVDAVRKGLANTASEAVGITPTQPAPAAGRTEPFQRQPGEDDQDAGRSRQGQPVFTLEQFNRLIGKAGAELDKLAEQFGLVYRSGRVRETPEHHAILHQMVEVKESAKRWHEQLKRGKQETA